MFFVFSSKMLLLRRVIVGLSPPFPCCSKHGTKTAAGRAILQIDCLLEGERRGGSRHGCHRHRKGDVCLHYPPYPSCKHRAADATAVANALRQMVLSSCQHDYLSTQHHSSSNRRNSQSPLLIRKTEAIPIHLGRSYLHELHPASSPHRHARNRSRPLNQQVSPSDFPHAYPRHKREQDSRIDNEASSSDHAEHPDYPRQSRLPHDRPRPPPSSGVPPEPTAVVSWKQPTGGGSLVLHGQASGRSFDDIFFPLWNLFSGFAQRGKRRPSSSSSSSSGGYRPSFFGGSYHHFLNYSYLEMMLVATIGYLLFGSSFLLGTHAEGGHESDLKGFLAPGSSGSGSSAGSNTGQGDEGDQQQGRGSPLVNITTTTTTILQPSLPTAAALLAPLTSQQQNSPTAYTLLTTIAPPLPSSTAVVPLTILSSTTLSQPGSPSPGENPSASAPTSTPGGSDNQHGENSAQGQSQPANPSPLSFLREPQELSKAVRAGLAAAAIGGVGGVLRRLGIPSDKVDEFLRQNQQQLESPPAAPTEGGRASSSASTNDAPPPATSPEHPPTALPSDHSEEKRDRTLRPSPQPYPVPVPYPVMYPAFPPAYATPVAAVAPAFVGVPAAGMRYTVPPAVPLSPLAAGPTAPAVYVAAPLVLQQQQQPLVAAAAVASPLQPGLVTQQTVATPTAVTAVPVMVQPQQQQPLVAAVSAPAGPTIASTTTTTVVSPGAR